LAGEPLETATVSVGFSCGQNWSGTNEEYAEVNVAPRGSDPITVSAWNTAGDTRDVPNLASRSPILDFVNAGDAVHSVYFVAVAANGDVTSGSASAEVNDTQSPGSDCTFAANILSP
jgi:hypothetical protein